MKTLKKDKDFEKVAKKGRPFFVSEFGFKIIPNNLVYNRYGVVISTKLDKRAVVRNKLRRRIKENIRALEKAEQLNQGQDIMFLFRENAKYLKYQELEQKIKYLFKKANLLK